MIKDATLSEHLAGFHQVEMARYLAIVAEVEGYLNRFGPALQAVTQPYFENMVEREFSQVVALLPYWLSDLLPVSDELIHKLGVAHLFGWWYYEVQDKLLDEETTGSSLLGAHLALLKMVEIYRDLGVTSAPYWPTWQDLALTSAQSYAVEQQTRFSSLAELTAEQLAPWTVEFIMERACPFYFNTQAQLHLAGVSPDDSLHRELITALRYFAAARQISDDANDWLEDLRTGRLNYVSARLIRYLYQHGSVGLSADLDFDYLVGYQLSDEFFWTEIEHTNQMLSQQALDLLASYPNCRLATLIKGQMMKHRKGWEGLRAQRSIFLELFGVQVTA